MGSAQISKAKRYGTAGWITGFTFGTIYALFCMIIPKKIFSLLVSEEIDLQIIANSSPYFGICIILDHS